MGVTPRGSYCRDLLETSRILDLYALLGLPLRVTLGYPSSAAARSAGRSGYARRRRPAGIKVSRRKFRPSGPPSSADSHSANRSFRASPGPIPTMPNRTNSRTPVSSTPPAKRNPRSTHCGICGRHICADPVLYLCSLNCRPLIKRDADVVCLTFSLADRSLDTFPARARHSFSLPPASIAIIKPISGIIWLAVGPSSLKAG